MWLAAQMQFSNVGIAVLDEILSNKLKYVGDFEISHVWNYLNIFKYICSYHCTRLGVSGRSRFLRSPWTSPCSAASFGLPSDSSGPLRGGKKMCIYSFPRVINLSAWLLITCTSDMLKGFTSCSDAVKCNISMKPEEKMKISPTTIYPD